MLRRHIFKIVKILVILLFVLLFFEYHTYKQIGEDKLITANRLMKENDNHGMLLNINYPEDMHTVTRFYERRKSWHTSNLGSIMFKNIDKNNFLHRSRENKTYVVFIWKYWDWLKERHLFSFKKSRNNPLEYCSVKNCEFIGHPTIFNTTVENFIQNHADAVVIHLQRGNIPNTAYRKPNQRWIFLSDESPRNTFSMSGAPPKLKNLAGVFNWSMTYRTDSDVPVPYGRTVPLTKVRFRNITLEKLTEIVPYWNQKQRDTVVAVLMSNCNAGKRMNYLEELKKHMKVDIHGGCATVPEMKKSCPGHFRADCKIMRRYLFYLVFENSECRQYITEKAFYHAYSKGAIPVILGPSKEDCEKLLPPDSYLHIDDYGSEKNLADEIENISRSNETLLRFHLWRNKFEVLNEHGYFGTKSYHYCRVCEALNYNDQDAKVYDEDEIRLFLDATIACKNN